MIKQFKKHIYKQDYITDIFLRSKKFYEFWKSSKYFTFPKAYKYSQNIIYYEYIDFKKYHSWYEKTMSPVKIIKLVNALIEFYILNSKGHKIDFFSKQNLFGDLHLWNIFFTEDKDKKILFIDPETPNSYDYNLFTYNTIVFELAYMLYHLDNHFPFWDVRFYSNNRVFKKIFFKEIIKHVNSSKKDLLLEEILKEYEKHVYRKVEFTYNPLLVLHRVYRFIVIYLKFIIWKKY